MGLDITGFTSQSIDQTSVPLATSTVDLVRQVEGFFKTTKDFSALTLREQMIIIRMIASFEHFYELTEDEYATIRRLIFQFGIEKDYSGYSEKLISVLRGRSYKQ